MKIGISAPSMPRSGALVAGVLDGGELGATAQRLDKATDGAIQRGIKASRFNGASGQTLSLVAPAGVGASRIILAGLGKPDKFDDLAAQSYGGAIVALLEKSGEKAVNIAVDAVKGVKLKPAEIAANMAYGALLRSYSFEKYRTTRKPNQIPSLQTVTVTTRNDGDARKL